MRAHFHPRFKPRPNPFMTLLHPPTAPWCVATPTGLQLRLLSQATAASNQAVFVRSLPDNEELLSAMQPAGFDGVWQVWQATSPGTAATR